jgi:acyl-coenzyme A synthetase/AMP-(fatty) acid ligase
VLPRAGASITEAELQAHVSERLAPFKVPSLISIVDAPLPRNASGKILKRELRDQLTARN